MTMRVERQAFLGVLRACEGTALFPDPYVVLFGSTPSKPKLSPFGYQDHPGNLGFKDWTKFKSNGRTTWSTACGAYQFLFSTWNRLKAKLGLPDFSPASQDQAAIELIRERSALRGIDAGEIEIPVLLCNRVWASLPGSPYGQPTKSMAWVLERYRQEYNLALHKEQENGG